MSNNIDSATLLSQLRTMAVQAGIPGTEKPEATATTPPFDELLKHSLEHVNQRQQDAASLVKSFELGKPGVELSEVMIEIEKAKISFESLSTVRNKLVKAYQEIMSMPV